MFNGAVGCRLTLLVFVIFNMLVCYSLFLHVCLHVNTLLSAPHNNMVTYKFQPIEEIFSKKHIK